MHFKHFGSIMKNFSVLSKLHRNMNRLAKFFNLSKRVNFVDLGSSSEKPVISQNTWHE